MLEVKLKKIFRYDWVDITLFSVFYEDVVTNISILTSAKNENKTE